MAGGQFLAASDFVGNRGDHFVRGRDSGLNLFGFQHGVRIICHIVSGHFEFGVSVIDHALLFEDGFSKDTGDSAVTAAGEDEIHIIAPGEGLLFQILTHEAGHFADIDRGTDDKGLFGVQDRMIL